MSPDTLPRWINNLVGRDWEIFWSPEGDYEDDWYEAKIEVLLLSRSNPDNRIPQGEMGFSFQVSFVGDDDTVHEMFLDPSSVRPRGSTTVPVNEPATLEWAESVVGMECEVFWKADAIMTEQSVASLDESKKTDFSSEAACQRKRKRSQSDQDEPDWYDATVLECIDPVNRGAPPLFRVIFAGDDKTTYEMPLKPDLVRPSARAWIRRTLALLQPPPNHSLSDWFTQLPHDTRTLDDTAALDGINERIDKEFPLLPMAFSDPSQVKVSLPSHDEHSQLLLLVKCIESQIFLRSQLIKIEYAEKAQINGIPSPTEPYLDHLVQLLNDLLLCCQWYYHCWKLHAQTIVPASPAVRLMDREKMVDHMEQGKKCILLLLQMDTSVNASRRKRQNRSAKKVINPPIPQSRRAKRKSKGKVVSELWLEDHESTTGDLHWNDAIDEEDWLLSSNLVQRVVESLTRRDERWFTKCLATMFQSLLQHILSPIAKWEKHANFYLGLASHLEITNSDDECNVDPLDDDDDDDPDQENSDDSSNIDETNEKEKCRQNFFSHCEIQALVHEAENNCVLKTLPLHETVERLRQKIETILQFENRAWNVINQIFIDVNNSDYIHDHVLIGLRQLQEELSNPDSPLKNVEPVGSSLTRKILRHATIDREWFLDLMYAESARERVALIEDLESRMLKLPSCPSKNLSTQFQTIIPRVQSLSQKCHAYNGLSLVKSLEDRIAGSDPMNEEFVQNQLDQLQLLPMLPEAQEMLAVRLDVLRWGKKASSVFGSPDVPLFTVIRDLYVQLDAIVQGKSPCRLTLVECLKPNGRVDGMIREFARKDIEVLYDAISSKIRSLYFRSSSWKQRAASIMNTLRAFGHCKAGDLLKCPRPPAMIEVKRIGDLLNEYSSLEVDLSKTFDVLNAIYLDAIHWSESVPIALSIPNKPFKAVLEELTIFASSRPVGIIIEPTRQIVEAMRELLQWHCDLQECFRKLPLDMDVVMPLLIQGIEILRLFVENQENGLEVAIPQDAATFLVERCGAKKTLKSISLEKLRASHLASTLIYTMTTEERDCQESYPLFNLLRTFWKLQVQDFLRRSRSSSTPLVDRTLILGKEILRSIPTLKDSGQSDVASSISLLEKALLIDLTRRGDEVEESARNVISESKVILREFKFHLDRVGTHHIHIKEILSEFRSRSIECTGLVLSETMEQQLEHEQKLFSWLARTLPYPALHTDDVTEYKSMALSNDPRIPYDVLVNIRDRIPTGGPDRGDYACVVLRVQELYAEAKKWQDDISALTMLSLRGGKRRTQSSPAQLQPLADSDDRDPSSETVEMRKLLELCTHPILEKVAMPREAGIRNMIRNSETFETALHQFLGEDCEGNKVDKVAIPSATSLVADDGTFHLLRLTGSPMFNHLRCKIEELSKMAQDVFAETPGKAAFDWILSSVKWIESVVSAITVVTLPRPYNPSGDVMVLSKENTERLLREGEAILLTVPDDLRQTLSQHKIYISTNSEGKLTVKSTKGGAHHAVGVVAIRWCPFVYDSLKADLEKSNNWARSFLTLLSQYESFLSDMDGVNLIENVSAAARLLELRDSFLDSLEDAADLVVVPNDQDFEKAQNAISFVNEKINYLSGQGAAEWLGKARYLHGNSLCRDRFSRLDALAARSALVGTYVPNLTATKSRTGPFRKAARQLLLESLRKGAKSLGVCSSNEEASALCAMRAFEIEDAMFERLQGEQGDRKISDEYKTKALLLKRCFEDVDNAAVCARLLAGTMDAEDLVAKSPEDLLSPSRKLQRAKAEARHTRVIAAAPNVIPNATSVTQAVRDISTVGENELVSPSDLLTLGEPERETALPFTNLSDLMKVSRQSRPPPPPPPPSLATATIGVGENEKGKTSLKTKHVSHAANGNRFLISVAESSRNFTASFCADDDRCTFLDGLLPEHLVEQRRTDAKDFLKFAHDKLESQKYTPIAMRMVFWTQKDENEYKKFCKDYEHRNRIATFVFNGNEKMYLLTPKFHRELRGLVTLEQASGAYCLILNRRNRS